MHAMWLVWTGSRLPVASGPDQAGAAGDQFDSDQEVTTSSAAEELQRRKSLNLVVEILQTHLTFIWLM